MSKNGTEPRGELFMLNENEPPRSYIEVGGPYHGRLITDHPQVGGQTIAWSLSDAIACTRELYEFGWFQWEWCPFHLPETSVGRAEAQEEMNPSLMPIIDRWNCGPAIALYDERFYIEPERPTNR